MNSIFMRFPGFRSKCLTLSYDDGTVSDKKLLKIMSEHGIKGTFNINSGWFTRSAEARMSEDEVKALYSGSGNEVAVHGVQHLPLAELPTAAAAYEILEDKAALEGIFGTVIVGAAYAFGSYSDKTDEVLKSCGISYARTTDSTGGYSLPENWLRWNPTCHHGDPNLMSLAEYFLTHEETDYYWIDRPEVFYMWGHSYEFENAGNWDLFEKFAEYMGGHETVWYATNGEIYRYVSAFNSLVFSARGDMVFNPSFETLFMSYYGKRVSLPPGTVTIL